MHAKYKLGNATFSVTFYDGDDEFTGACSWEVKRKYLADVWAQGEFRTDDFNDPSEWQEFDEEDDDPDETIYPGSADALICFAAAASECRPAEYAIDYHGSAYWFFHDMIHAEYDSGDGTDIYIDSDSEERALPMGAVLAAKAGVSIAEILRELVKAGSEFESRFGYSFDPIDSFLDSVGLVLK